MPTVLVHLGFWGDTGIVPPFESPAHWEDVFLQHAHSVVPKDLFERRIDCGPSWAWFLVRTRPVLHVSPPLLSITEMEPGVAPQS